MCSLVWLVFVCTYMYALVCVFVCEWECLFLLMRRFDGAVNLWINEYSSNKTVPLAKWSAHLRGQLFKYNQSEDKERTRNSHLWSSLCLVILIWLIMLLLDVLLVTCTTTSWLDWDSSFRYRLSSHEQTKRCFLTSDIQDGGWVAQKGGTWCTYLSLHWPRSKCGQSQPVTLSFLAYARIPVFHKSYKQMNNAYAGTHTHTHYRHQVDTLHAFK